ncbi:hypothetical protein ACFY1P_08055 [Streptomyces sp. NPDC001407]|uniref:hypothetical protein n=1 Tax=Streptomyces sp. NPDC001407 TaxID=3364573 RepID=UPI0036797A2D
MDEEEVRRKFMEILSDWETEDRQRRSTWTSGELIRAMKDMPPAVKLAVQAVQAQEIRDELVEAVELDVENFTVWALRALSPYSDAVTIAEAEMRIVRHNIKKLLRREQGDV